MNALTALDPEFAARSMAFADRGALYAVCPFDLDESSLAIIARAGETPMSLVFVMPGEWCSTR